MKWFDAINEAVGIAAWLVWLGVAVLLFCKQ